LELRAHAPPAITALTVMVNGAMKQVKGATDEPKLKISQGVIP